METLLTQLISVRVTPEQAAYTRIYVCISLMSRTLSYVVNLDRGYVWMSLVMHQCTHILSSYATTVSQNVVVFETLRAVVFFDCLFFLPLGWARKQKATLIMICDKLWSRPICLRFFSPPSTNRATSDPTLNNTLNFILIKHGWFYLHFLCSMKESNKKWVAEKNKKTCPPMPPPQTWWIICPSVCWWCWETNYICRFLSDEKQPPQKDQLTFFAFSPFSSRLSIIRSSQRHLSNQIMSARGIEKMKSSPSNSDSELGCNLGNHCQCG